MLLVLSMRQQATDKKQFRRDVRMPLIQHQQHANGYVSFAEGESISCCGCCSFHVEQGAWWVAVVGIVLSTLYLFSVGLSAFVDWGGMLALALCLLIHALILVALRKRNSVYYIPYLLVKSFAAIVYIIAVALILLSLAVSPGHCLVIEKESLRNYYSTQPDYFQGLRFHDISCRMPYDINHLAPICILFAVLAILGFCIIWPLWVVWRAYQHMRACNSGAGAIHAENAPMRYV